VIQAEPRKSLVLRKIVFLEVRKWPRAELTGNQLLITNVNNRFAQAESLQYEIEK